jgi:hypothetical protein
MTKENKELLLKDLCGRLPYGVKVGTADNDGSLENVWDTLWYNTFTEDIKLTHSIEDADKIVDISEIKPYLFPISSMTDEQKYDFYCRFIENDCDFDDFKEFYFENNEWHKMLTSIDDIEEIIDWFNKNHFDFRCLIPKGLAIDATNLNIY